MRVIQTIWIQEEKNGRGGGGKEIETERGGIRGKR